MSASESAGGKIVDSAGQSEKQVSNSVSSKVKGRVSIKKVSSLISRNQEYGVSSILIQQHSAAMHDKRVSRFSSQQMSAKRSIGSESAGVSK